MSDVNFSQYNGILSKLRFLVRKKGFSMPGFYLEGTNREALEKASLELTDGLLKRNLVPCCGIVPYFTIRAPYFNDERDGIAFLHRFRENLSIAADCYSRYQGIAVIELSREWAEKGPNSHLEFLQEMIRQQRENVCFILLAVTTPEGGQAARLFESFQPSCVWQRFNCGPDGKSDASHFCRIASSFGYEVSEEAESFLVGQLALDGGRPDGNDVVSVFRTLMRQISFDRSISLNRDRTVRLEDVRRIALTPEKKVKKNRIGFVAEPVGRGDEK